MAKVASAKRHAQALYQIAQESGDLEKWRSELKDIAAALSDPGLAAVLENPKTRMSDKLQLIDNVLADVTQLARNFAYLIVAKQRLSILDQVVVEYERMADAHAGLEHARVTTAVPLDRQDSDRLADRIAQVTGKRIVLESDVDPSIVGGFVARIGDKLVDGSTKARLEALKKTLVRTAR